MAEQRSPNTTLERGAVAALADMIGMWEEGGMRQEAKRTILELFAGLQQENINVSDYQADIDLIGDDIDSVADELEAELDDDFDDFDDDDYDDDLDLDDDDDE